MPESITSSGARDIAFESFGVRLRLTADTPEVMDRLPAVLPPGARPCPPQTVVESFGVLTDEGGTYRLERGGSPVANRLDPQLAVMLLRNQLGSYIGFHSPHRIFVRAGVVAHDGRAIVIPAPSLAGTSTLVLELVRAGAAYYSDEFAILDEEGRVHPYPTPPSPHEPGPRPPLDVAPTGGGPGSEPLPIGAVVLTTYRPGAQWAPAGRSPGHGVAALLAQAPAATSRPAEAMHVISRALDGAVILEGERGEARDMVPRVLTAVSVHPPGG